MVVAVSVFEVRGQTSGAVSGPVVVKVWSSCDSIAVSKDNAGSPSCCPVRGQQGAAGTGHFRV